MNVRVQRNLRAVKACRTKRPYLMSGDYAIRLFLLWGSTDLNPLSNSLQLIPSITKKRYIRLVSQEISV